MNLFIVRSEAFFNCNESIKSVLGALNIIIEFKRNFPLVDVVGGGLPHLLLHEGLLALPVFFVLLDILDSALGTGNQQDCRPLLYEIFLFFI